MLSKVYEDLWNQSVERFKNEQFDFDKLINSPKDTRRGLTLLSRFSEEVSENITAFLNRVKLLEPNQYFYPKSDFHLTVLSIITCYEGFLLTDIHPEEYLKRIVECLNSTKTFKINFRGITASPSCVMIQGFSQDNQINILRDKLRDNFKNSAIQNSIDSRYSLKTAHSTVIRFQEPMNNSSKFIELLEEFRNYEFGILEIDNLEIVFNDWYQKQVNTRILSRIKLN